MTLKEMRRRIQEITFPVNNNAANNYEVLCYILTEDNNILKGRVDKIEINRENRTITYHFFECFPRS